MGNHDQNLPMLARQNGLSERRYEAMEQAQLIPATPTEAYVHLGACLALVASTGMTDSHRTEWLKVAHMTLADLPADLVARGCDVARRKCRFPSEVVPVILEEVGTAMSLRRYRYEQAVGPERIAAPAPREPDPEYVDPAELTKLLADLRAGGQC